VVVVVVVIVLSVVNCSCARDVVVVVVSKVVEAPPPTVTVTLVSGTTDGFVGGTTPTAVCAEANATLSSSVVPVVEFVVVVHVVDFVRVAQRVISFALYREDSFSVAVVVVVAVGNTVSPHRLLPLRLRMRRQAPTSTLRVPLRCWCWCGERMPTLRLRRCSEHRWTRTHASDCDCDCGLAHTVSFAVSWFDSPLPDQTLPSSLTHSSDIPLPLPLQQPPVTNYTMIGFGAS
jgi:hypothetical protein